MSNYSYIKKMAEIIFVNRSRGRSIGITPGSPKALLGAWDSLNAKGPESPQISG
jgi:hypothetical protein